MRLMVMGFDNEGNLEELDVAHFKHMGFSKTEHEAIVIYVKLPKIKYKGNKNNEKI